MDAELKAKILRQLRQAHANNQPQITGHNYERVETGFCYCAEGLVMLVIGYRPDEGEPGIGRVMQRDNPPHKTSCLPFTLQANGKPFPYHELLFAERRMDLYQLNDRVKLTFAQIADLIEAQWHPNE